MQIFPPYRPEWRCPWHRLLAIWVLCWLGSNPLTAQQDPHHTQYIFNGLAINPAYAGSRGTIAATFLYRNQWLGFSGAPETQSLSLHMPGGRGRYGFGFTLVNDQIGHLSQQWLQAAYAFRIPVGAGHLALGLQGGLLNFRVRWEDVQALEEVDAIFAQAPANMLLPNVGSGVYFSTDRFYLGLSAPHILESRLLDDNPARAQLARLYRHVYFTGGYVLGQKNAVQWKPSFLLKYVPGSPLQADFNLMALLRKKYWLGVSFRPGDAISAMLDFQIVRHFRVGYAYDYTISNLANYQSGSHELYLGFELVTQQSKFKSPRFF
ncbi:MAG: type IX secretion system membrane protein PorP/SprF [Bacteroidota bacterium]